MEKGNCYIYSFQKFINDPRGCILIQRSRRARRQNIGKARSAIGKLIIGSGVAMWCIGFLCRYGSWVHLMYSKSMWGPWESYTPKSGPLAGDRRNVKASELFAHVIFEGKVEIKHYKSVDN